MECIVYIIFVLFIFIYLLCSLKKENYKEIEPKILIIIISTEKKLKRFQYEKKIWEKYYKKYKNIKCIFTECYEDFTSKENCKESYIPGIYQKSIQTLSRYNNYDYYIRTNLSSFFIFSHLIPYLKKHYSIEQPVFGGYCFDWGISGTGIIMNKSARNILVKEGFKKEYFNNLNIPDDVLISKILLINYVQKICPNTLYTWNFNISELENINIIKEFKIPCIRLRLDNQEYKYKYVTNLLLNNFYL